MPAQDQLTFSCSHLEDAFLESYSRQGVPTAIQFVSGLCWLAASRLLYVARSTPARLWIVAGCSVPPCCLHWGVGALLATGVSSLVYTCMVSVTTARTAAAHPALVIREARSCTHVHAVSGMFCLAPGSNSSNCCQNLRVVLACLC